MWFNDPCKETIKKRKKVKSSPIYDNIQQYKIIRGQTRLTLKSTRHQSWRNFVKSINNRTPVKKFWNMINKIYGKRSRTEIKHLQVGDKEVTTDADIADTLAESFLEIYSKNIIHRNFNLSKLMLNVKILNLTLTIRRHITFLCA